MQYEEFVREMHTRLQERLKEDYEIREEEVIKCNDTRDRKLIFARKEKGEVQAVPSVSIKGFFEMHESGIPAEECERVLLRCVEDAEARSNSEEWEEAVLSWEAAKNHVYPVIKVLDPIYPDKNLDRKENEKMLSKSSFESMKKALEEFYPESTPYLHFNYEVKKDE